MLDTLNIAFLLISIASLVAFGFLLVSGFKRSVLWGLVVLLVPFGILVYGIKFWNEVKKPFLAYVACNTLSLVLAFSMFGAVFSQMGGMGAIEMAQNIQDGTMTEQDAARFMKANMDGMKEAGFDVQAEMVTAIRNDPNMTEADIEQFQTLVQEIEQQAAGPSADAEPDQAELDAAAEAMLASLKQEVESEAKPQTHPGNTNSMGMVMPAYVDSPIKGPAKTSAVVKKTSGTITFNEARHYVGHHVQVTNDSGITRDAVLIGVNGDTLEFQRRAFGGTLDFKVAAHELERLELN